MTTRENQTKILPVAINNLSQVSGLLWNEIWGNLLSRAPGHLWLLTGALLLPGKSTPLKKELEAKSLQPSTSLGSLPEQGTQPGCSQSPFIGNICLCLDLSQAAESKISPFDGSLAVGCLGACCSWGTQNVRLFVVLGKEEFNPRTVCSLLAKIRLLAKAQAQFTHKKKIRFLAKAQAQFSVLCVAWKLKFPFLCSGEFRGSGGTEDPPWNKWLCLLRDVSALGTLLNYWTMEQLLINLALPLLST